MSKPKKCEFNISVKDAGDIPELVVILDSIDLDCNGNPRNTCVLSSSQRSSDSTSSAEAGTDTDFKGCSAKKSEIDILDVIHKMWPLDQAYVPDTDTSSKLKQKSDENLNLRIVNGSSSSSSWGFTENMPIQGSALNRSGSSSSGITTTTLSTIPEEDDDVEVEGEDDGGYSFSHTNFQEEMDQQESPPWMDETVKLCPEDFHVYSHQSIFVVGWEIFHFVEHVQPEQRKHPLRSWLFKVQLARPDGSVQQLVLLPVLAPGSSSSSSTTTSSQYFCSFFPTETGLHLLSVTVGAGSNPLDPDSRHIGGSPVSVNGVRSYVNTNGYNFVRMGFPPQMPFCSKAWAIAVFRPNNWIYLADRESHEILVLDSNSNILNKFGTRGFGPGQLCRPAGIAVDRFFGRVIVTDKDNHRVAVFDVAGNFIFNFGRQGHGNGEFNYPWGIAVSPNGQCIAVADSKNHRIQLFDCNGKFLRKFSVFETRPFEYKTEFWSPRGIAFNLNGTLIYVTDCNLHAVFVFNLDLAMKRTFVRPGYVSRPQGITVDEGGNVLICDSKNNCIHVLSPSSHHVWSMWGSELDKFLNPTHVAVLRGGRLVVVDNENRLRIF